MSILWRPWHSRKRRKSRRTRSCEGRRGIGGGRRSAAASAPPRAMKALVLFVSGMPTFSARSSVNHASNWNIRPVAHPHTSVSVSSFFKHIDCELPEPQRARQLLIWCSNRAMNELADQAPQASSSRQASTNSGKDPPPLSTAQTELLKRTEESLMRMLAEKKVDTNVYGAGGSQNGDAQHPLRENEQNIKNRAREARFNGHIQRCAPYSPPVLPAERSMPSSHLYLTGRSRRLRRGRSCRTRTIRTESRSRQRWRSGEGR